VGFPEILVACGFGPAGSFGSAEMGKATVTICGDCGKQVCSCEKLAPHVSRQVDSHFYDAVPYATNARCYAEPLVRAPIILPTVVDCAVYGREIVKR
jgi:hypothetical protein